MNSKRKLVIVFVGGSSHVLRAREALLSKLLLDVLPSVRTISWDEAPSGEELRSIAAADVIDAVVLIDHGPFSGGVPEGTPFEEAVRQEALRAIVTLELQRRALRTVFLSSSTIHSWNNVLGTMIDPNAHVEYGQPPSSCLLLPSSPLIISYLQPLFASIAGLTDLRIVWPREVFYNGDIPGEALPPIVEVAGRARIIAYGPYQPLPTGRWRAKACVGFGDDVGKLPFIIEADTGDAVSRGYFEVTRGGIFSVEFDFQVSDWTLPVEFRLISQDSALEGRMALIEIELRRL